MVLSDTWLDNKIFWFHIYVFLHLHFAASWQAVNTLLKICDYTNWTKLLNINYNLKHNVVIPYVYCV